MFMELLYKILTKEQTIDIGCAKSELAHPNKGKKYDKFF